MGDSYRAEIARHHKKSGFGAYPLPAGADRPRTLLEERRALRIDYFKKKAKRRKAQGQGKERLI